MGNAPAAPVASSAPGVPPPSAAPLHASRPGVALAVGFIPGLGAVYNGEYMKALIQVLVFGSLIAAQDSRMSGGFHALLGIAIACFYFYMPIDAYRVAKAREVGGVAQETFPIFDMQGRRPTGALVLIALGVFLLLSNLGLFDWDWFGKLWPAGLIALGAWILVGRMHRESGSGS
jgi:hypothetical protein